ncbi:MAG: DUF3168 domain-containing protein [Pseudooceanicola sp.]|nr:DUF3168 domain-containing protein [Pseudooceanicola sp.]
MGYVLGEALQAAVYQRLLGNPELEALVGMAIYDALPAGPVPGLYVLIGAEEVQDRSDATGHGSQHRFWVSVVTDTDSYGRAKLVAAAVSEALSDASLPLSRGRLVGLWFERATARRSGKADRSRRIDLRFRARLEDS